MPELVTEQQDLIAVMQVLDPLAPRPEGWHVSDLIHKAEMISKNKWTLNELNERKPFLGIMQMGQLWEYAIHPYVKTLAWEGTDYYPQLQREVDGIHATMDGLIYGQGSRIVVECKLKFGKPIDPRDNWRYMAQVKSYCHMMQTLQAWMPILFVSSAPPNVEFKVFKLVFKPIELAENWQMLLETRKYLEEKGETWLRP